MVERERESGIQRQRTETAKEVRERDKEEREQERGERERGEKEGERDTFCLCSPHASPTSFSPTSSY